MILVSDSFLKEGTRENAAYNYYNFNISRMAFGVVLGRRPKSDLGWGNLRRYNRCNRRTSYRRLEPVTSDYFDWNPLWRDFGRSM